MNPWIDSYDFAPDWRDHGRLVQTYADGKVDTGILDYEDFSTGGDGEEYPCWQVVIGGHRGALGAFGGTRHSLYNFEFCRFID
jgi:hypothetical protein